MASSEPGGVNAHLGRTVVRSARIVRQSDGQTMARWNAPMFEAV